MKASEEATDDLNVLQLLTLTLLFTLTPTLTRNDLNMLVKTAHDRRQNFTDDAAPAILNWNRKRKTGTDDLKKLFG